MADRDRERERQQTHQLQVHPQNRYEGGQKYMGQQQRGGPSTSKVLAVLTMLPVGGSLLFLAGMSLIGTVIGLILTAPIFIICSPVLVPAAIAVGLAVTGFLSSGAMSLTALSSLSWVFNCLRGAWCSSMPEKFDHPRKRTQLGL